ncbi:hypothetical protein H632_c1881p0, partial [Helicosporidium sp. ATCC 50920]
SAFTSVLM